jgi:branched-chain amino acid transport system ATP-binding protein
MSAPSENSMLEVDDLGVVYSQVINALGGVNLRVGRGQIVAMLGPNGAGKTTLLRALTGLLSYHDGKIVSGQIRLDGKRLGKRSPAGIVAAGVAQVMEGRRIFAEMSVDENLSAGAVTLRDRKAVAANRENVFGLFPVLANRRHSQAGYLSGGEQQMLAIGRAMMSSPDLLILDEPSLGLAPMIVQQIRDIIAEINELGATVLLVEQNAAMALSIADYGYILTAGRVAKEGPASELADDPEVRQLYLGVALGSASD